MDVDLQEKRGQEEVVVACMGSRGLRVSASKMKAVTNFSIVEDCF